MLALDTFADADTQRAAHQSCRVQYSQGHFDAADFERALSSLDFNGYAGLAYGSGFEAAPDLLELAAQYLPLIGNTPLVLRNMKRPRQFFMLLDGLQIPHPQVSFRPLDKAAGWLYKQGGGSGGTHVRKALPLPSIAPERGCYFQREVKGVPVSLLFVANGEQIRVIGFNRQWLAPSAVMPYRYGGAASQANLPEPVRQQLIHAAQQLTNAVGLRGFNSLDAIMDGDQVWVLEINPRLSATFDLYQSDACNLFDLHLRACAGDISDWPLVSARAKAHQIVYAPYDLVLSDAMNWPAWAADLPLPGSHILANNPICTVCARGDSAEAAQALVLARAKALEDIIENNKR